MRTRLTRQPGQPGTKQLVAEYGAKLVCVRSRYDAAKGATHKNGRVDCGRNSLYANSRSLPAADDSRIVSRL